MSRFISFDGTSLAFDSYAPETAQHGDTAPVVLLHGFAADSYANWVRPHVVDALVGAGRHVVALDARGHGRSEKPHDPGAYADHAMVRDVQALLDHLGASHVDVCGYSMGALTTMALAVRDPRVRAAVLGGVGARTRGRALAERAPRIAEALVADDPTTIGDPTAAAFRAFADSSGADRHALAAIQRSRRSPLPDVGLITVPTLVITGDLDTLVGSPHDLAARIEGAAAKVVAGDHLTAVYDAAFSASISAFLSEVQARHAIRGST